MNLTRVAALAGMLAALVAHTPAYAAPGTLEASVVECAVIDGQLQGTVGVSITGAEPSTETWIRVSHPLIIVAPPLVSIGFTDATGSLSHRFLGGPAAAFPVGVAAYTSASEKIDPGAQIGNSVLVEFVCPVLTPQDVVDDAIESGVLSEREATPLAVKLGAAADQEDDGNTAAAINLLQAAKQQINGLIASRRLTAADAQALLDALNREITRLGGTA